MHSSHSGVSLALDIFISPGFLKCRVTHLIAGDLWTTFIVDGCNNHPYFLLIYVLEKKTSTYSFFFVESKNFICDHWATNQIDSPAFRLAGTLWDAGYPYKYRKNDPILYMIFAR